MPKWNENPQILFEITRPEQKGPNNFQDALHNNYLKKSLVKFRIYSTWGDDKNIILQNKKLHVKCEGIWFLYRVENRKNQGETVAKMLFHDGHY